MFTSYNPMSLPSDLRNQVDPNYQKWKQEQDKNQNDIMNGQLMQLLKGGGFGGGATQYGDKALNGPGYKPSMFFNNGQPADVTGQHLLQGIEQDYRNAAEAERQRYKGMQDAIGRIRSTSEAGAKAVEQAGLQDLMKAKEYGDQMIPIADKAFEDMKKQYGDVQSQFQQASAKAQQTMQGAASQYNEEAERQKAAAAQALAQQSQERKDQTGAQMGGAVPGTQDQVMDAGRQIDNYADTLKFKTFADIDADRAKTHAQLQAGLAQMQMGSAQFSAGLGQQGIRDQFTSAQAKIQARQVAASIYQFSAQQSAQSAQIAAQLRMNGEMTAATFLERNPQHPVSITKTLMAAMQAQRMVPRNTYGVYNGMTTAPNMNFGGGMGGFSPMSTPAAMPASSGGSDTSTSAVSPAPLPSIPKVDTDSPGYHAWEQGLGPAPGSNQVWA